MKKYSLHENKDDFEGILKKYMFVFLRLFWDTLTTKYMKQPLPHSPVKSVGLSGLFWDSGSGFHNPSSSPLPHPAKSSAFSAFKCPLISLAATHCVAVIWPVPIVHLQPDPIYRLVCQPGEAEQAGVTVKVKDLMFLFAVRLSIKNT